MKLSKVLKVIILAMIVTLALSVPFASAEERTPSENRYYLGEAVKTGLDNGYEGNDKIKEGDVHFNWEIGRFFVDGFTSVAKDDTDSPVFLKNVGDTVTLWFNLEQDIDKLNNDEHLSISDDNNGSDEYFSVPKSDFGRGTLIIRKTDYMNAKNEPIIYTDYLDAKASLDSDTEVELFEEGDYEIALDYEIKNDPRKVFDVSIIPTYSNYRLFFKFSVRNGNSMVYPFDIKTKSELMNTSVTENGFYLDFANSRYLDVNIKKEVLNEGADGLVEDVRYNRPAKDGEEYSEEGIYTITSKNNYTGQVTVKKIYVGKDDVLKAVAANGLSVTDVQDYIANGAIIESNGTIKLASLETIDINTVNKSVPASTKDQSKSNSHGINLLWIFIGGVGLVLVLAVIIYIVAKTAIKRKQEKNEETSKGKNEE